MSPTHLPSIIIDMRCLQDRNYAERGIGNHARNVIGHVTAPFIGVFDPALPALPADWAARAAMLSPHGYIPGAPAGSIFLNPSPMSADQNFIARILCNREIIKAALVYDFIPLDDQPHYLTHPVTRLDYFASLAWLRRYDRFFPISADTDAQLRALYAPACTSVTGVALPGWLAGITPETPGHILMIGGADARKNPETLLRAHAASPTLRGVKLIITGQYTDESAKRLRAISDVTLPGRLSEAQMRAAYAGAFCVVAPSRAEGFSLPVIEAMAAQTPAIVSDIPAHRALITDASARFAPDDAAALTAILERLIGQPELRRAIIAAQAPVLRDFTPAAVAAKIWDRLIPARPAVLRRAKPRVALLSPLPPAPSGVADYSAAFAAALAHHTDITLFPGPAAGEFPFLSRRFDRVITAIGNSPLHARIHDLTLRHGASVICHDARLLGLATARGLEHAAMMASAELARLVTADEITIWTADESLREASFLGPLAAAARPLIFHNRASVAQVKTSFGVTSLHLPMAIYRPFTGHIDAAARAAARRSLGYPSDVHSIASFGFIGRNKGIETLLHAISLLQPRLPCRLLLIGPATPDTASLRAAADEIGIAQAVTWGTDFIAERQYRQHLLAANAGVQLRAGGPGNISGALQDCIAAGLPGIANHDLADNLDAPSYITRVSDQLDAAEIAQALYAVLTTPRQTEAERSLYCETHSMAGYAESLMGILALRAGLAGRPRAKSDYYTKGDSL